VGPFEAGPESPRTNYIDTLQNSYEGSPQANRHIIRFGFDARRIVLGYSGGFAMSVTGSRNAQIIEQIAARGGNIQDPTEYPLLNFGVSPQAGYVFLDAAHGMPHGGEYNTRLGSFVQDSIKLSSQLTLNRLAVAVRDTVLLLQSGSAARSRRGPLDSRCFGGSAVSQRLLLPIVRLRLGCPR